MDHRDTYVSRCSALKNLVTIVKLQMCHHLYLYKSICVVRGAWSRGASTPGTPPGAATGPYSSNGLQTAHLDADTMLLSSVTRTSLGLLKKRAMPLYARFFARVKNSYPFTLQIAYCVYLDNLTGFNRIAIHFPCVGSWMAQDKEAYGLSSALVNSNNLL